MNANMDAARAVQATGTGPRGSRSWAPAGHLAETRPMPPRLVGELRAEWTKLRTLNSTWWMLAALVLVTVTIGAMVAAGVDTSDCRTPESCGEDTVKLSLTGVWPGQVAAAILGVLAVSAEYGTGTIRTTLTAMPARPRVLVAKVLLVSGLTVGAGALAVLGSLIAGRFLLADGGFTRAHGYQPISVLDGTTARAAFGTVLYFALIALLSLGLAWALRDTAGAITAALVLLYMFPILVSAVGDETWAERLTKLAPASAGMSIQATRDLGQLAIGPWAGLGVLAAWAAGALSLGLVVLTRRDV